MEIFERLERYAESIKSLKMDYLFYTRDKDNIDVYNFIEEVVDMEYFCEELEMTEEKVINDLAEMLYWTWDVENKKWCCSAESIEKLNNEFIKEFDEKYPELADLDK